ncbi:hypothetical protein OPQ81_009165 [Rhizoctonia solani]|nr:hypothetical protein OPQ81_009165 [Rhizoctonia solani]
MGDDEEEQAAAEAAAQGEKVVPCSGTAKPFAHGMFNEALVTEEEQEINHTQFNQNWPDGYHYINPETKYGPFEGRLVSKAINVGLFKSCTLLGAHFKEFFKDMEEPLVAYILAVLQFCIEEWESGSYKPLEMDADYLLSLYICHYKGLVDAQKEQPNLMEELHKMWWSKAL